MSGKTELNVAVEISQTLLKLAPPSASQAELGAYFSDVFQEFLETLDLFKKEAEARNQPVHSDSLAAIAKLTVLSKSGAIPKSIVPDILTKSVSNVFSIELDGHTNASYSGVLAGDLLSASLKLRELVEALPLGQDSDIASVYLLSLATELADATSGQFGETPQSSLLNLSCEIIIQAWGQAAAAYYNPSASANSVSSIRNKLDQFVYFTSRFNPGIGEKARHQVAAELAQEIKEISRSLAHKYSFLNGEVQAGIEFGIANKLATLAERGWRVCIDQMVYELDQIIDDEKAAVEWLDNASNTTIRVGKLVNSIEYLYSESGPFSHDADIDLSAVASQATEHLNIITAAATAISDDAELST